MKMTIKGVDFDSFVSIVTGPKGEKLTEKNGPDGKFVHLNTITKEPYIGCGLVGNKLINDTLPAVYYNMIIKKPVLLVGPSGTGKTALGECIIQNFYNVSDKVATSGNEDRIISKKYEPIHRIQNYANILPEAVNGEWNAMKIMRAPLDIDPMSKKNAKKFFKKGVLSAAIDTDDGYGVLLDEITRAFEETQNVYLEPLREEKVTTEGICFGRCKPDQKRDNFIVFATANEGDIGTQDLSTALQTRLSRIEMGFIDPGDEQELVMKTLFTDKGEIKDYPKREQNIGLTASCLTGKFRGSLDPRGGESNVPLDVKPSIKDGIDIGKILLEMDKPDEKGRTKFDDMNEIASDPKFQNKLGKVLLSILGKKEQDAKFVASELRNNACKLGKLDIPL
jgi:MoxR-like ATPase